MKKDFLLRNDTAKKLYEYAGTLPVIDFHNHLSLDDIRNGKRFTDIYELWIKPDPYKHRAMRMCGVPEKYITGSAPEREKFCAWCSVLPKLTGNPLYHWSVMELEAVLGKDNFDFPSRENALEIYEKANHVLMEKEISVKTLLDKFGVRFASPCASVTDDISFFDASSQTTFDTFSYHTSAYHTSSCDISSYNTISDKASGVVLAPSLRADDILAPSPDFVQRLSDISGVSIKDMSDFKVAVKARLEHFKRAGCVFADIALDNGFEYFEDDGKNEERFERVLNGEAETLEKSDKARLFSYLLTFVCRQCSEFGFVLQLHIGAQRYTSTYLRKTAGAAGGYACIGNSVNILSLTRLFDKLERLESGLAKTVIYTLNPADNAAVSVLSGSYAKDGVSGLITQGAAWWWCDHEYGIREMLKNTANYGLLYNFIGMTTDSRSFLSFVRHDYFRRILCGFLGEMDERGEILNGYEELKHLVGRMCYQNARNQIMKSEIIKGEYDYEF